MKITELVNGTYCFSATIRAKRGKSLTTVKTIVFANGISQARALLSVMYGEENVVSVSRIIESQLGEAVPDRTKPKPAPNVLPTEYKHDVVQQTLLNKMKQNALRVKPTVHDLKVAQSDFEAEQKRVDRKYEDAVNDRAKWAEIRKNRIEKSKQ